MNRRLILALLLAALLAPHLSAQGLGGRLKKLLGKDKTEQVVDTAALPAGFDLADGRVARRAQVSLPVDGADLAFAAALCHIVRLGQGARLEAFDPQARTCRAVVALGQDDKDEKAPYYTCRLALTVDGTRLDILADSLALVAPGFLEQMKATPFERLDLQKDKARQQMEGFLTVQDGWLEQLAEQARQTPPQPVTHWDEIRQRRVVKGMNTTEALLAGGPADFERQSSTRLRWMMPDQSTILFEDGRVVNIVR